MLETVKYTCAISAAAVTHTHTPQTREITGTTDTTEAQETTAFPTSETGESREITEANMTTTEATGLGRKTSP